MSYYKMMYEANDDIESSLPSQNVCVKGEQEEDDNDETYFLPQPILKCEPEILEESEILVKTKSKGKRKLVATMAKQSAARPVQGGSVNLELDTNCVASNSAAQVAFSCDVCGKSFKDRKLLKRHMYIHSSETPFSCEECGKSFSQKCHLNRHVFIHKNEPQYFCDSCGRSFNDKSNLKRHLIIHTGRTPYSCTVCGERFKDRGNVKRHMIVHIRNFPFSCDICGKSFSQQYNLKRHFAIHKNILPLPCGV